MWKLYLITIKNKGNFQYLHVSERPKLTVEFPSSKMYTQHKNSGAFVPFCLIILKTVRLIEKQKT